MRTRNATLALLLALGVLAALASTAVAHELTVTKPQTGEVVHVQWIGGDTVPVPAQDAPPMFGPFSLPPSHGHGLPHACMNAEDSPAISIAAPPFFTGCEHGLP
jgi:hypothetical protein